MKSSSLLYKDKNIAIVNKTERMDVSECMDRLIKHLTFSSFNKLAKDFYVSPIGSLDKAVSGIQVFGLNPNTTRELNSVWNSPRVTREYLALVKGEIEAPSVFKFSLENDHKDKRKQTAVTYYSPVKNFRTISLIRIWSETECKQQIRRHFSRRCMVIMGDRKFGQKTWNDLFSENYGLNRIFLHAHYLTLDLKSYNKQIQISSPLPPELKAVLEKLICFTQPQVFSGEGILEYTT